MRKPQGGVTSGTCPYLARLAALLPALVVRVERLRHQKVIQIDLQAELRPLGYLHPG